MTIGTGPLTATLHDAALASAALRFLSKVRYDESTGCWLWQGCTQDSNKWHRGRYRAKTLAPNLRGRFRLGGRIMYAHRAAWLLFRGELTPDLLVMHSECDVTLCVCPWHLGLGTHEDNSQDMAEKGRHWTAQPIPNGTLHRPARDSLALPF